MVVLATAGEAARGRAARGLVAGIHRPPSVGLCPGIERGLQEVLPGHAVGPAPLEGPRRRPLSHADPELARVWYEIAQQGRQGAECVKLAADQPPDVLPWRIGIEADCPRDRPNI